MPQFYTKLISKKNFNGLILSSDSSFKIILAAESYYLYLTNNLKQINVPNLEKILYYFYQ